MAGEIAAPFGHGLLTRMDAPASGLAIGRLAVHRVAEADRVLHKTAAPPASTPLTLAVAPVLPVDEALRRLDSTEAGLTSDGADARRARFGPNVLTSHRVTALGPTHPPTPQPRPVSLPPGPSRRPHSGALRSAGRRLHERLTEAAAVVRWVFSTPDRAGQAAERFRR